MLYYNFGKNIIGLAQSNTLFMRQIVVWQVGDMIHNDSFGVGIYPPQQFKLVLVLDDDFRDTSFSQLVC